MAGPLSAPLPGHVWPVAQTAESTVQGWCRALFSLTHVAPPHSISLEIISIC